MNTYKLIGNDGLEYGPADLATIRAWVAEGRIAAGTRVQAEGTTEWKPASAFPELGAGVPIKPPPPPPQARKSPGSTLTRSPASKPVPSVVFLLVAIPVALAIAAAAMIFIRSNSRDTQTSSPPNPQMSQPAIVPPSPVRSLEDQPYRKAAEEGDAEAQSRLGDLYAKGIGVGRDYGEAAKWYRKSAEQGNPNGQHWLGHCYLSGSGVAKDETEAFKWFREAANNGNIAAQRDLGGLYATGRGVEQNSAEAIKWYRKAAEAGLPAAQNDFAWMLATSTDASLRNGLLAVTFAEKAVTATRRSDASFLDTLAAAYAEAGDFEKAVAIQNEAITLLKDAASKQDYTSRLRLYEAKTPYRETEKE